MIINGLRFEKTSFACPEQYDVFLKNKQVGYLRLRHGVFRIDCPDCGRETIFTHEPPEADGIFNNSEQREYFLKLSSVRILEWLDEN